MPPHSLIRKQSPKPNGLHQWHRNSFSYIHWSRHNAIDLFKGVLEVYSTSEARVRKKSSRPCSGGDQGVAKYERENRRAHTSAKQIFRCWADISTITLGVAIATTTDRAARVRTFTRAAIYAGYKQ